MAKGGKLTKLKSAIKRLHSMSKLGRTGSSTIAAATDDSFSEEVKINVSAEGLRPVYVGKCRRRYLISSDIMEQPLFQEVVDRSGAGESEEGAVTVACEVVLFEHLLWMLDNAVPDTQLDSMDNLAHFYTYS
ncbi:hypothetical protein L1049_005055 [Liquidambar formosana]|uniref:Small auxin up regulated protein n=1 Tax=Liquidambar formosana TaxID=63359 RepID=A0AAP0X167_LIQFO